MNKGLRVSLVIMGFVLIITGILLNMQLYISIAPDGFAIYQASYGFVGVVLDISKVLALMLGVYLLTVGGALPIIGGVVAVLTYAVLSVISLMAGWGFGLVVSNQYEQQAMLSSAKYEAVQANVDSAASKVEQFSQFAAVDVATLSHQRDTLKAELAHYKSALAGCPHNYVTKCIQPNQAKISAIRDKLTPVEASLLGNQQYQAALAERSTALNALSSLDGSDIGTSHVHPLFIGIAQVTGVTPQTAKNRLLLVSFAMLEYLGAFFYAIGLLFNRRRVFTAEEIQEAITYRNELLEQLQAVPLGNGQVFEGEAHPKG